MIKNSAFEMLVCLIPWSLSVLTFRVSGRSAFRDDQFSHKKCGFLFVGQRSGSEVLGFDPRALARGVLTGSCPSSTMQTKLEVRELYVGAGDD